MCCVRAVTCNKDIYRKFLSFSEENLNLLPACMEKCLTVSDPWHTCNAEILLFKKFYMDGEAAYEGRESQTKEEKEAQLKKQKLDADTINNIDYKNIENLKVLEKLEENEDLSFVMAPLCKLRNHCYQIAAASLRVDFNRAFLFDQCNLINRLIEDLKREELNDFIFQSLIDVLRALKKDR